jgi:hypothetical protein
MQKVRVMRAPLPLRGSRYGTCRESLWGAAGRGVPRLVRTGWLAVRSGSWSAHQVALQGQRPHAAEAGFYSGKLGYPEIEWALTRTGRYLRSQVVLADHLLLGEGAGVLHGSSGGPYAIRPPDHFTAAAARGLIVCDESPARGPVREAGSSVR